MNNVWLSILNGNSKVGEPRCSCFWIRITKIHITQNKKTNVVFLNVQYMWRRCSSSIKRVVTQLGNCSLSSANALVALGNANCHCNTSAEVGTSRDDENTRCGHRAWREIRQHFRSAIDGHVLSQTRSLVVRGHTYQKNRLTQQSASSRLSGLLHQLNNNY